jgi:hypothetical protein
VVASLDERRLLEGDLVEADRAHPAVPAPVAAASTAHGRRLKVQRENGVRSDRRPSRQRHAARSGGALTSSCEKGAVRTADEDAAAAAAMWVVVGQRRRQVAGSSGVCVCVVRGDGDRRRASEGARRERRDTRGGESGREMPSVYSVGVGVGDAWWVRLGRHASVVKAQAGWFARVISFWALTGPGR